MERTRELQLQTRGLRFTQIFSIICLILTDTIIANLFPRERGVFPISLNKNCKTLRLEKAKYLV